ncbi:hypothetical protein NVP1101O_001 [Vibrio phage 1.101.O._10N.261.45.C6]|nr:hypothetical protein NVP1101O_001 [Vibrio phage 1.101.O._10N.261.45.C6]
MKNLNLYSIESFDENGVRAKIKLKDFISLDNDIQRYQGNRNEQQRVLGGEADHCKQINVFNTHISLVHYTGDEDIKFALYYECVRDADGILKNVTTDTPVVVNHKPNDTFVIDGNTRRFAWRLLQEKGLLSEVQLNTELNVSIMSVSCSTEVRKCYEMFDTKVSTKSAKHTMETVAAQVGLDSRTLSTLKGALNLVSKGNGGKVATALSKELGTEVDAYEHLVNFFGKDHIRGFSSLYKKLTGKTSLQGMSPHIVAYRKLREDYGNTHYGLVDDIFTSWFKKEFDPKMTISGSVRPWDWMCDVTNKFCHFNPKGATSRINVLTPTLVYGMKAKIDGDTKVRTRLPFRDNEDGVKSLQNKIEIV